jgi:hypothetical protein
MELNLLYKTVYIVSLFNLDIKLEMSKYTGLSHRKFASFLLLWSIIWGLVVKI